MIGSWEGLDLRVAALNFNGKDLDFTDLFDSKAKDVKTLKTSHAIENTQPKIEAFIVEKKDIQEEPEKEDLSSEDKRTLPGENDSIVK